MAESNTILIKGVIFCFGWGNDKGGVMRCCMDVYIHHDNSDGIIEELSL